MKSSDNTLQESFISKQIVPIFSGADRPEHLNHKGKKTDPPVFCAFFGFIIVFSIVRFLLPDNLIGNSLAIILFPSLFLASFALLAFIYRQRLAEAFIEKQKRFLTRTRAMHAVAEQFNLDYIPLPGGPAPALKILAGWRFCPQVIKDLYDTMDAHGGFDDISEIIRASGLAVPREVLIGSKNTREKQYIAYGNTQQLEDGFKGSRNGLPFAAAVWKESDNETKTHHFMIVLKMPKRLTGTVEFKTRKALWPVSNPNLEFKNVALVSTHFKRNFEVRATDQMEGRLVFDPAVIARLTDYGEAKTALHMGDEKIKIRGGIFGDNLVVDFIGEKRFDIFNIDGGEWDITHIQKTVDDIQDMLTLVDGVTGVFRNPMKFNTKPPRQENAA